MFKWIRDEFKSSPVQFLTSLIGLIAMIIGGLSSAPLTDTANADSGDVVRNGSLYALTISIAITLTCAIIVKFIPSGIASFLSSIVIASINYFLVLYIVDSNLIGGLSGQQLNSARNAAFYGIMAIYSIFNFRLSSDEFSDGGALIFTLFFYACIWGGLVSKGEGYITGAFSPSLQAVKIDTRSVDNK